MRLKEWSILRWHNCYLGTSIRYDKFSIYELSKPVDKLPKDASLYNEIGVWLSSSGKKDYRRDSLSGFDGSAIQSMMKRTKPRLHCLPLC